MSYVRNQKDADRFAKDNPGEHLNDFLEVDVPQGCTVVLNGVRWLAGLTLTGEGTLECPDLLLITGDLVFDNSAARLVTPQLACVQYVNMYEDCEGWWEDELMSGDDFHILKIFNPERCPQWVHPEIMYEGSTAYKDPVPVTDDRDLVPIASDCEYALFYNKKNGHFVAGCRNFKDIQAAIKHWKENYESYQEDVNRCGGWLDTQGERGLMFAFALTFFEHELFEDVDSVYEKIEENSPVVIVDDEVVGLDIPF